MNELRDILPLQYFRTKLEALLYLWQNVKIPVAKCKYTREEPVAKCKIGPQRQNVAPTGKFFMLWARQSWGKKEKKKKKRRERRRRKKRKREERVYLYILLPIYSLFCMFYQYLIWWISCVPPPNVVLYVEGIKNILDACPK